MKILYSPASPYSAKVRMAARHLGIAVEEVKTDTNAAPAELLDNNPLGKIPVLIRDIEVKASRQMIWLKDNLNPAISLLLKALDEVKKDRKSKTA